MPAGADVRLLDRFPSSASVGELPTDDPLTMNLEQWRDLQGWSYAELATAFGWSDARTAQRYASGENYPSPVRIEQILRRTNGAVSVLAMHRQHIAFLHRAGKLNGVELIDPPQSVES